MTEHRTCLLASIRRSGPDRQAQSPEPRDRNTDYRQRNYFYFVFISLCSRLLRGSLFAAVFCVLFFSLKVQAEPGIPERLKYNIYWLGIRAGNASFEVTDTPEGISITTLAESARFISIFYKVKDFAKSILKHDGYPLTYILKTSEGRHKKDKSVFFESGPSGKFRKIYYNNRLNNTKMEINLEKQVYDPLSGFYEIRKRPLQPGISEYLNIFDSKKLWNVEVQVLGKEYIKVPAGNFDTIIIKPLLSSEGIFSKKGEMHIWLTNDEKRIPVMVKSKIKIGNFVAKLVEGEY